jgi:hypothetical protein
MPQVESASTSAFELIGDMDDFERIRRAHLSHEASIRSFGLLYFVGGAIAVLAGVGMLVFGIFAVAGGQGTNDGMAFVLMLLFAALYASIGALQVATGRGLRKLNSMGKNGGTFLGAIGLIGFPIGTIISSYLLYLIWSAKGKYIFSSEYQQVLKATPHVVYKTSKIVWVLAILLFILVFLGIAGILIGA